MNMKVKTPLWGSHPISFGSVQFSLSVISNSATPWTAAHQASLSITNTRAYSNSCPQSQWCHLILLSRSPPAFNLSQHPGLFKWVNSSHQVAKVLEFQLYHHSLQQHPGLISFKMDLLDLLAVQGTLKSLLQNHNSKASTLWPSAFLIVQPSYPYMTTGKTIAVTRQTFVGKVMSLLFNMLYRLVITFLPRIKLF